MNTRFQFSKAAPGAYKAMDALEDYVSSVSDISPLHKEMIRIRASQINGCAYCLNMHTKDARNLGETEQRIYLLSAWRDSPQYTEEERLILAVTEEVTLIHRQGLTEETYQAAVGAFGASKLAAIIMMVVTINAWNRIGISAHLRPE